MAEPATDEPETPKESFAALLEESLGAGDGLEGTVLKGTVVAIEGDAALVDVGLKSEGRVALKEFAEAGQAAEIKVGDVVEVYLERMENKHGETMLSREKAKREEAWTQLEKSFADSGRVTGVIFGRVKGGFTVDLSGAVAFLPGSQVDIRPVRDVGPLMGSPQPFQILKMDRSRGNIVVSRRAVLEETRAEQRAELIAGLAEGQVLDGVVKNITDYGAFVDLGGVDGLLHVTDIAWKRINHPSDALSIGQQVKVQVIRFNRETQRISLGMKQLETDPWDGVAAKYPIDAKFVGRVTNITDYGAFVELEPGIEGLIHVSEMSWTKKNIHPGKIISTSQEVEVKVLNVDGQRRRISLGLKQCGDNPWEAFLENYPTGTEISGRIKNITEFGLFVGLPGEIDGMVHFSDLDWSLPGEEAVKQHHKGDTVNVKVLDVDTAKERISLGIKQLTGDPFQGPLKATKKGSVVTCTVHQIVDNGIEVRLGGGVIGFIRKGELSRDRGEQRPDRFAVGEKVDAKITSIDAKSRKIALSIKQRETEEEKKAIADYGSTESGARLGDILGAALSKAAEERSVATPVKKPLATEAKAARKPPAETEAQVEDPAKPAEVEAAKPKAEKKEPTEAEAAKPKAEKKEPTEAKAAKPKAEKKEPTEAKAAKPKAEKKAPAKAKAAKPKAEKKAPAKVKTSKAKAGTKKTPAGKSASATGTKKTGTKKTGTKATGTKKKAAGE